MPRNYSVSNNNHLLAPEKAGVTEATVERPPLLLKLPNKRHRTAKRLHADHSRLQDAQKTASQDTNRGRKADASVDKASRKTDRTQTLPEVTTVTELTLPTEDIEEPAKNCEF